MRGVIVDEEDKDLLEEHWTPVRSYFARRRDGKTALLHRVILERKLGRKLTTREYCDHIDGNPKNNSRRNLRVASPRQNRANALGHCRAGYKGVRRHPNGKWQARIGQRSLGYYPSAIEAGIAYMRAAIEEFGEYARSGVVSPR